MNPRKEVPTVAQCRKLNKRFGRPKNPAWWWWRGCGGKPWSVVTRSIPIVVFDARMNLPAHTLADLFDLAGRKGLYISIKHSGWNRTYYLEGCGRAALIGDTITASTLARAILAVAQNERGKA